METQPQPKSFKLGGAALPRSLSAIAHSICEQNAITADQLDCKWEAWALANSHSTGLPSEEEFRAFAAHLRQKALKASVFKSTPPPRKSSLLHSPGPTPTRVNNIDEFFNYLSDEAKKEVRVKAEPEPLIVRNLNQTLDDDATNAKRSRLFKAEPIPAQVKPHDVNHLPGDDKQDEQYANRTGSGRVEASLDNSEATPHNPLSRDLLGPIHVQPFTPHQPHTRYMHNPVLQRMNDVRSHTQTIVEQILSRLKLLRDDEMPRLSTICRQGGSPATILIAGRIRTELEEIDASCNATINLESVILEGEDGHFIKLNLHRLVNNKHPFFINPGMVVVVEGVNTNGKLFDVHAIYDNAMQTSEQRHVFQEKREVKMEEEDEVEQHSQPYANLIVAAGPFTRQSNLKYEPLSDLLQIIQRNKPHVVILTGPFVEESHQHISPQTPMPYDEVFVSRIIVPLQATIATMAASDELVPQFVLIPALEDVHHDFVCPQPAFRWPFAQVEHNIHLCPNPCVLEVSAKDGQYVSFVGATSLPTLQDISADSLCRNKPDRLGSIVSHMLRQRSFYPSFPPSNAVPLDTGFLDRLEIMDVDTGDTVDMIIVPSKLKAFAKSVDGGAIAVNPGLASRESDGGTYAEIALPLHNSRQRRSIQANEDTIEVSVIRL
eukprot:gb/GEZJ01003243.1/.p1 GENE.gb/GEZJ01003243.1/~~gb/GEZJ01003243.1/.p1  ORF type:complete len:684 (-),score=89.89 gb/GEZJ01003243.1/:2272-4251(-)